MKLVTNLIDFETWTLAREELVRLTSEIFRIKIERRLNRIINRATIIAIENEIDIRRRITIRNYPDMTQ